MAKTAVLLPRQEMQAMSRDLIDGYKHLVPMCIESIQTSDVCVRARELEAQGCELIVARGLQAALIKQSVRLPVVGVMITAQELGILTRRLVRDTGLIHPKIGLVGFENMMCDTSMFDRLFDVELVRYLIPEHATADTAALLLEYTDRAVREGCQAIISGDLGCARAAEHGLPHSFLASGPESLRNAFATAERVAYAIDLEKRNSAEMNTMLDFTFSGILQVDARGVIRRSNRVAYHLLHLQPAQLLNRPVEEVLPHLGKDVLRHVLADGEERYALLVPIGHRAVIVNAAPVRIEKEIRGAILTFQEGERITEINSELRRELYQRGFLARHSFDALPVEDAGMKRLMDRARTLARFSAPILITGAPGTWPTAMAQCLHNESLARSNPFVDVDCAAFNGELLDTMLFGNYYTRRDSPACLAEAAQNGTLFLDHVEALPPELQFKVLQLLHGKLQRNGTNRPIASQVRIIAATHANLMACVERGAFRSDLYYALNVLSIHIPPLSLRRDDILPWVDHCLKEAQETYKRYVTLTKGARAFLRDYDWPGNLDQLRNICQRTVLTAERRSVDEVFLRRQITQLSPRIDPVTQQAVVVKNPKALELAELLKRYGGNRQKVAAALGVSKTTLWRYMKKYGIGRDFSC